MVVVLQPTQFLLTKDKMKTRPIGTRPFVDFEPYSQIVMESTVYV